VTSQTENVELTEKLAQLQLASDAAHDEVCLRCLLFALNSINTVCQIVSLKEAATQAKNHGDDFETERASLIEEINDLLAIQSQLRDDLEAAKEGFVQKNVFSWLSIHFGKRSRAHGEARSVSGLGLDSARDLLSNWDHEEDRAKLLHEVQALRVKDSATNHQLAAAKAANSELSLELETAQTERAQLIEEVNDLLSIQAQVRCFADFPDVF
jgi:hypothetical protein